MLTSMLGSSVRAQVAKLSGFFLIEISISGYLAGFILWFLIRAQAQFHVSYKVRNAMGTLGMILIYFIPL